MTKHRAVILALGLAALIGLTTPAAHAGPITMTITVGANSISFDYTNATYALGTSTPNNLRPNLDAVNNWLNNTAHSALNFGSDLGSLSNNPGAPNPTGATLSETGTAVFTNTGAGFSDTLTVAVTQSGFTIPSGPGTLGYSSTANFTSANAGDNQVSSSSFNGGSTPPVTNTFVVPGPNPQSYSFNGSQPNLTALPTGYSLDNSATITLSAGQDQFTLAAKFTAVPEPASLLMMLTGMPLPLVVMALLRRRRATA